MKHKRAYTLIEVIVVIFIVLLLGDITLKLCMEGIRDYTDNVELSFRNDKLDNSLLNFDVVSNCNGIISIESNYKFDSIYQASDIKGDNIFVKSKVSEESEDIKLQIIYLKNDRIMLRTLNYIGLNLRVGNNVLVDNVESFKVNKKANLIYYYIKSKEGDIRIRCI